MKILDILRTASGNLWQSKLRTFLTVVAIFIGAFTLTLTNGIGAGISQYIDEQVGNLGASNLFIIQPADLQENQFGGGSEVKKYDPERTTSSAGSFGAAVSVLTKKDLTKIKAREGIASVQPYHVVAPDYISGPDGDKFELRASAYFEDTNIALVDGKLPDNKATDLQISLPSPYLEPLGFANAAEAVGKNVTIATTSAEGKQKLTQATVVGVQEKSIIDGGSAMLNQALVDTLFNIQTEGLPTAIREQYQYVTATFNKDLSEDQVKDLQVKLAEDGYLAQTVQDQIGIFKQVIKAITYVFNIFGLIALLAASFGVINTLLMAVQERTKEIGLMKAIGMSSSRIFLLFSTEAILLGFWGSVLGVLAAYGVGTAANQIAANGFLKDLEGLELIAFPLPSIAVIVGLIMLVAFLAGTLPSLRAARLSPIDALRYE